MESGSELRPGSVGLGRDRECHVVHESCRYPGSALRSTGTMASPSLHVVNNLGDCAKLLTKNGGIPQGVHGMISLSEKLQFQELWKIDQLPVLLSVPTQPTQAQLMRGAFPPNTVYCAGS